MNVYKQRPALTLESNNYIIVKCRSNKYNDMQTRLKVSSIITGKNYFKILYRIVFLCFVVTVLLQNIGNNLLNLPTITAINKGKYSNFRWLHSAWNIAHGTNPYSLVFYQNSSIFRLYYPLDRNCQPSLLLLMYAALF